MLRITAVVMVVVGALYVSLGVTAFWIDRVVLDPDRLASRSRDLLDREEIRSALSEAMVDAALEDAPMIAQFARPLLRQVVRSLVGSQEFAALLSTSIRATAVSALETDTPEIVLRLPDALVRVREAVTALDPGLAAGLPSASDLESSVVTAERTVSVLRRADRTLAPASWVLLAAGTLLLVGGVLVTDRRRGLGILAGMMLTAWTVAIALALLLGKALVTRHIGDPIDRAAAEAVWEVLFRGVQTTMMVVAVVGVLGVGLAWLLGGKRWERGLGRLVPRVIAILVAVVGVVLVVGPYRGTDPLSVLLGCVFVVAGLAWFFPELWRDPRAPPPAGVVTANGSWR